MVYTFTAIGSASKTLTSSSTPYPIGVLTNNGQNAMTETQAQSVSVAGNGSLSSYGSLSLNWQNDGAKVYVMLTVTGTIPARSAGYVITVSNLPNGEGNKTLTLYINNSIAMTVTTGTSTAGQNSATVTAAAHTVAAGDTLYFYPDAMNNNNLLTVDITGFTAAGTPHLIYEEGSADDNNADLFTINTTNAATGDFVLVATAERTTATRAITLRAVDGDGIDFATLSFNVQLLASPSVTVANAAEKTFSNRSWYKSGSDLKLVTVTFAVTPEAGVDNGDAISIGSNSNYSGNLSGDVYTISVASNDVITGATTSTIGGDVSLTDLNASQLTYTVRLVDPSSGNDTSQAFAISDIIGSGAFTNQNIQIGAYQDAAVSVALSSDEAQVSNAQGITYTATCSGGIDLATVAVDQNIFGGTTSQNAAASVVFTVGANPAAGTYTIVATLTDNEGDNASANDVLTVYANLAINSTTVQNIAAASETSGTLFTFTATGGKTPYTFAGTNVNTSTGVLSGDGTAAPGTSSHTGIKVTDALNTEVTASDVTVYYVGNMTGSLANPANANDAGVFIISTGDTLAVTQTGGWSGYDPDVTFTATNNIAVDTVAASNSASNNPVDPVWDNTDDFFLKITNGSGGDLSTSISFSGSGAQLTALTNGLAQYVSATGDAAPPTAITYTAGSALTTIVSVGSLAWGLANTTFTNEVVDANTETAQNADPRSIFNAQDVAVSSSYGYALSITPGTVATTAFGEFSLATAASQSSTSLVISEADTDLVAVGYTLCTTGSHFASNTTVTAKSAASNGQITLTLSAGLSAAVSTTVAVMSLPTSSNRFDVTVSGTAQTQANVYQFASTQTLSDFDLELSSNANDISEFTNSDGDVEYNYTLCLTNANNERLRASIHINFLGNITTFEVATLDSRSYPYAHYFYVNNAGSADGSLIANNDYILQVRDSTGNDGTGSYVTVKSGTAATLATIRDDVLNALPDRKSMSVTYGTNNRVNYRLGLKSNSTNDTVLDDYHYVEFNGLSTVPSGLSTTLADATQFRSFNVGSGASLASFRTAVTNDGLTLERARLRQWPHGATQAADGTGSWTSAPSNLTGANALRSYLRLDTLTDTRN